eukprot:maker-scaffold6367_size3926-snap-gene-0.0 protein:Tk06563 transcript:maker-scaffold6367_size3926-snap-gene-0.0-mRNA-1 annotation:"hypothetical protein D910_00971"
MLKAGMIKRLASGLYTWGPLGLKVLRKVENVVREEMNSSGAVELLMPSVQPSELWKESGRWEEYGPELLRINDRSDREFCYGPTHEEVITDYIRNEINSYKQLPINYYQIQTKFRDEIRPRFGVMRSREFLMKDAYSFHANSESLQETYDVMYETYQRVFTRLGLNFRPVQADNGSIGGNGSHEFHVLADSGDPSPDGNGKIEIRRGIEVGHIFQLGTKYSETMDAKVLDVNGKKQLITMGCYGIGVSRVVASCIEQNNDDKGIIWPAAMAPFQVALAPLNYHKSEEVKQTADKLYADLLEAGCEVILDDRNIRPGAMFADMELIGIPHRVVISDRGLKNQQLEYKSRTAEEAEVIELDGVLQTILDKLA